MDKKKQNKGFSLVELVVVVLIMGIIATALAPQVMKWVEESKKSADFQAEDGLKEMSQVALAEYEADGGVLADEDYNITSSGAVVNGGGTDANAGMLTLFEAHLSGNYPKVQADTGRVFQIQVRQSGKKVQVTTVAGTY